MVRRAAIKVAFLPIRSPKWPKNTDPSGRAKKAREKVASDWSMAAVSSDVGKNNFGKTSTAAVA